MKTTKSKIIAGVTALVLLFGVFFMVKAMEKKDQLAKVQVSASVSADVPYFYNGPATTDITVLQNTSHWSTSQNPDFECGGPADVPCSIPAESLTDLNTKLQACSDINDVMSEATGRRQDK